MKHCNRIIVSALLVFIGVEVWAQAKDYLAYYPGDEAAWLAPLAEGTVDSRGTVADTMVTGAPKAASASVKGSGEPRAVCEFEVPELKAAIEDRLVAGMQLQVGLSTAPTSNAPPVEVWLYRKSANG